MIIAVSVIKRWGTLNPPKLPSEKQQRVMVQEMVGKSLSLKEDHSLFVETKVERKLEVHPSFTYC